MTDFIFKEETEESNPFITSTSHKKWRVLVVDDDDSVHQVTKLVLTDVVIENRQLEIVSVYSMNEAKQKLTDNNDFCMAFVDVVMETDHAGLDLVQWIRKELKNQSIRLILRTGQAGSAPEAQVIKDYDINDYKEKTDFTANKMITTVYASIRAYRDITTIQRSLDAFKKVIEATHDLLKVDQLKAFGSAALNHLLSLMDVDSSALYIARNQVDCNKEASSVILACTGKYVCESDSLESSTISDNVKNKIQQAFINKQHFKDNNCFVGFYQSSTNAASVLFIEFEDDNEHFKASLAEIFATNVALILESLTKQKENEKVQKELFYILAEAAENRGKETRTHVKRIALFCELLAVKSGLDDTLVEALCLVAPLYDLGKVAIPTHILHKPEKLADEEWQLMQTHAQFGNDILKKSPVSVLKLAAKLAHYHHENWDGSGYPEGLAGQDIPVEARIMAIVDVFDALGSKRCYKEAWTDDKIKEFLIAEKNKKFDAALVDIVINSFDEFTDIRARFPDN